MMNFNMVTNELELLGNSITNVEINNRIIDYNQDLTKSFGLDVKDIHIDRKEKRAIGVIQINIQVEILDKKESLFKLDMDIKGAFSTDLDTDDDKFMRLLYINGVSALLGIARGKIESITAVSFNSGKISIPFVNVMDYYKEVTMSNK